jgi:hypothetical protein
VRAVDATTLARAIREQKALPLSDFEADALARSLERATSDEEFLANTLAAVRMLIDRLEPLPHVVLESDGALPP